MRTLSSYCESDEYRAGQLCCLACPGGYRVRRDCTATTNTKCSRCPDDTFKEGLSGQKQCSACTKCDPGLGLKEKKSCTPTSDVLCKPLDGFFCIDSRRGGCRTTQRHRLSCSPGQYIGQRGTADEDTECLHCTDGTFSNGTSSCQPHTTAASTSCPADEYRAGQVCCLACPGGYRVRRDCTATTNTKCSRCPDDTFKEGLSGQKQCSACTECVTGLGLKEKKSCTPTSDVLCKPLDGFFCIDSRRGGCRTTQRHRLSCSPGQYIGQRGVILWEGCR
ncbi:unnamed protein product [Boreogadus saida]